MSSCIATNENAHGHYIVSPDTRAKLSLLAAKRMASMPRQFISKLEDRVALVLQELQATYFRQYYIRDTLGRFAASLDFYFPQTNKALEVNGTFWHADPRVYPNPKHTIQLKNLKRYQQKCGLLAQLGIDLVEVWELDLNKDIKSVVNQAYAKICGVYL